MNFTLHGAIQPSPCAGVVDFICYYTYIIFDRILYMAIRSFGAVGEKLQRQQSWEWKKRHGIHFGLVV